MVTTINLCLLVATALLALISGINFKVSEGDSLNRYYIWKLFGFGVMVHKIHGSDPEGIYHNHPWNCLSIIFGSYVEWLADVQWDDGKVVGITAEGHLRRFYNLIAAKRHHRVELIGGKPVWTVIFHLPRSNRWSTINNKGGIAYEPWKGAGKGRSYAAALEASGHEDLNLTPKMPTFKDTVPRLPVGETLISKSTAQGNLDYLRYLNGDSTHPEKIKLTPVHVDGEQIGYAAEVGIDVKFHDIDGMVARQQALERAKRWQDDTAAQWLEDMRESQDQRGTS